MLKETVIATRDTLPAAVDYEDRQALFPLDYPALYSLLTDCQHWCSWMDGLRAGVCTPAGRTEWDVLMREEREEVAAAQGRVEAEIDARGVDLERDLSDSVRSVPGISTRQGFRL